MAAVSLVVFNNPDASVYIIFLPFIPIPSSWVSWITNGVCMCLHECMCISIVQALAGIVSLDIAGLIRGWQFFDHAGHLGGVLFAMYEYSNMKEIVL